MQIIAENSWITQINSLWHDSEMLLKIYKCDKIK